MSVTDAAGRCTGWRLLDGRLIGPCPPGSRCRNACHLQLRLRSWSHVRLREASVHCCSSGLRLSLYMLKGRQWPVATCAHCAQQSSEASAPGKCAANGSLQMIVEGRHEEADVRGQESVQTRQCANSPENPRHLGLALRLEKSQSGRCPIHGDVASIGVI